MLTSIDSPIRNCNLVLLETRTKDSIYKGLNVILRDYSRADYFITKLQGDHEFGPLLTDLKDNLDIELDIVVQGDHVPEAERNNDWQAHLRRISLPTLQGDSEGHVDCFS